MSENITQVIEKLAEKLGATGAHLYEVMARQAFVNGIVWSAVEILLLIIVPLSAIKLVRVTHKKWDELCRDDFEVMAAMGLVIGGLIAAIVVVIAALSLPDSIMSIFNPEYYAIKSLLEALK